MEVIGCIVAIVVLLLILIFLLIKYYLIKDSIKKLNERLIFVNNHDTNLLLDDYLKEPHLCTLTASINANIAKTNALQQKITQEENNLVGTITNLSHDLRTPITSLLGYSNLLLKANLDEKEKEYVKIIESRIIVLKDLVEELFQYSLSYEDVKLNLEKVDVINVLEDTLVLYYDDFAKKGFKVNLDIENHTLEAILDPFALKRIFANIIGNALKHGNDEFYVRISNSNIIFANLVHNIDLIDVNRIFDRFFTVAKARTNGSTGLGLSISKMLIERMGGSIIASITNGFLEITISFKK